MSLLSLRYDERVCGEQVNGISIPNRHIKLTLERFLSAILRNQRQKVIFQMIFDLFCAGFPCQAFSIAGRRGGFEDTRGTLFFDVAEIIKKKQPKAIFLENVKGLRSHDKWKTFATILNILREDLNYYIPEPQIINAREFGVPQNRERIYIVGFRKDLGITDLGVSLKGRAFRFNLFVRTSQKGYSLRSLTLKAA